VAGKLGTLIKALHGGNEELGERLAHGICRIGFLSPSSLALRRSREEADFTPAIPKTDLEALSRTEDEFFQRMRRRLSLKRIGAWLDHRGGKERFLVPAELIQDEDSFIRFVYALLYGDSRKNFDYAVEEEAASREPVTSAGYSVPDIRFRKKHEPGS
jgi:hypothetical protein